MFIFPRDGFRPVSLYLFTTLLDKERYSLASLVELYGFRYHVEFDLRYVKSTLDMDLLSGKSVDIVKKELYAGLLAYNLIRGFMARAAKEANTTVLALSFTLKKASSSGCAFRLGGFCFQAKDTETSKTVGAVSLTQTRTLPFGTQSNQETSRKISSP